MGSNKTKGYIPSAVEKIDLADVIRERYMEYAKSTITERMFPFLDGFKPVQLRALYTMHKLSLENEKTTKSAKVVGDTMGEYHPHGDSSIYEATAHLADCYEGLNAPLAHGDGTFGKQWADRETVPCSDQRYTEIGLSKLATETLFNGLNENAVDMVDNYLLTSKEPTLLPTAFPNIIVNATKGIACGLGTYLPTYGLKEACLATAGLLEGTIHNEEELAIALGVPDFPTGGKVGISKKQLLDLCETGETKGIVLTSKYVMENKTTMIITEIPFNTTVDKVYESIDKFIGLKVYLGITKVKNITGDLKLGIKVSLQRGTDPAEAFQYLCAFTDVQKKVSFSTKFVKWRDDIQNFDLYICGVYDLLSEHWIPWRLETYKRIYEHRVEKIQSEIANLKGWLKIDGFAKEYLNITADNTKTNAVKAHMQRFGLTSAEEKYLIDESASKFTQDEIDKNKEFLLKKQNALQELQNVVDSKEIRSKMICKELRGIAEKYGHERASEVEGIHTTVSLKLRKKEKVVQETYVGITAEFFLKRADSESDANTFADRINNSDRLEHVYRLRNTDKLLVFTTFGYVYKINVDDIDNIAKTKFKDTVWNLVSRHADDKGEPFLVIPAGNYDYEFNIVYPHTAVRKIKTSMYKGRNIYKDAFSGFMADKCFITEKDEFLLITEDWHVYYTNLNRLGVYVSPSKKQLTLNLPTTHGKDIKYVVPVGELDKFGVEQMTYYGSGFVPLRKVDLKKKSEDTVSSTDDIETICGIEVEAVRYLGEESNSNKQEVMAEEVELADNLTPEEVLKMLDGLDENLGYETDDDEDEESDLD